MACLLERHTKKQFTIQNFRIKGLRPTFKQIDYLLNKAKNRKYQSGAESRMVSKKAFFPQLNQNQPSICFTLTSPFVLNAFLRGHIALLSRQSKVTVCINTRESDIATVLPGEVEIFHTEIRREISLFKDASALVSLYNFYRKKKFDAVITVTPKGGLLGMVAAYLAKVPVRWHWFTGQVWLTKKGLLRAILKGIDRLTVACSTRLLADSPSQRKFLVGQKVVLPSKINVLGNGSISGVDIRKFRPDPAARRRIRRKWGIPNAAPCLLYVGRMRREKGVLDLLASFKKLREEFADLHLLLVGPDEERLIPGNRDQGVSVVGYTKNTAAYMAAGDIICLPSYREGFGSVLIEGAACGLPSVASRIYGITDAVVENQTGLLHRPGNVDEMTRCLRRLLSHKNQRKKFGSKAWRRAKTSFRAQHVEKLFASSLTNHISMAKNLHRPQLRNAEASAF